MVTPGDPAISSLIRRFGRIGLFSVACAASAVTARAQFIWNGAGTSNNWSDPNNWVSHTAPSGNAQIHFAGNIDLTPLNDQTFNASQPANSIVFDAQAGAFTVSGNSIALTNGITNNSTTNQTINLPVQLAGAQTWSVASGNLTVNSTVDLNGHTLITAGANDLIFNAAIIDSSTGTGGGSFIVQNANGRTTLNGVNTYTGNTIVSAGDLFLNGSIASGQTNVNPRGTLLGNGTIGGNLTNNGIVVPIDFNPRDYSGGSADTLESLITSAVVSGVNSVNGVRLTSTNQTLTVKGNYTQSSTGTLVIAYGGPASNQHTALNVQGQASLNGTLRLIQVDGGRLSVGQEVPIVTAAGGVTGKFSLVENAALINATVMYEPTSVVLETTQGSLFNTLRGLRGVSSNLLSIANALDAAANDPRAAKIFAILNADNLNRLIKDVQHISPDQLTSTSSAGASSSGVHLQNLQLRMQALQSGVSGFSAMGFHVTDNSTDSSAGYAGPTGPEGKGGKEVIPPPANDRWGSFITGAGEFDRVGDTSTARGFNLDSGGITLGVDYRFTDHFVAGLFAGYTYTGIDIADGGRIAVDAGKVGLYATYFTGGFYVNSAVQGGYDTYETNRAGLGGTAHSSPIGGDLNVLFAPGYNWTIGGLTFGPTSRFQYSYQSTNGFTETGSLAPLTVASQHTESIVSAFGMKASYDWKFGTVILRPELRLEWEHEYGDVATSVAGQLASGAGDAFAVTGPEIGRDSMHLGAGFAVVFSERLSAYAYYDGEFFRTNYDSSVVTGGLRVAF